MLLADRDMEVILSGIYVCVTHYNESIDFLVATLNSLIESYEDCFCSLRINIFVIIDNNYNNVSYLASGLLLREEVHREDLSIYKSDLTKYKGIHFYIKRKNCGKLDSHRVFFGEVAETGNASFIVQVDSGVCFESRAFSEALAYFDNPECRAVSLCSLPTESPGFSLIDSWQENSFYQERYSDWVLEEALGYMTVLPGQAHIVRWDSMKNSDADGKNPINKYLVKLEGLDTFFSNMYLAEDRILGMELSSFGKNRNSIRYSIDAKATLDNCKTVAELYRQRKRWVCGSFACSLWFQKKSVSSMLKGEGLNRIPLLLYLFLSSMVVLFCPIITAVIHGSVISELQGINLPDPFPSTIEIISLISIVAHLLVIYVGPLIFDRNWGAIIIRVALCFLYIFFLVSILIIFIYQKNGFVPLYIFLVLFVSGVFIHFSQGKIYIFSLFSNFLSRINAFWLGTSLNVYGIIEFHRPSWGTKGLNKVIGSVDKSSVIRGISLGLVAFQILLFFSYGLYAILDFKIFLMLGCVHQFVSILIFALKKFSLIKRGRGMLDWAEK